MANEMGEEGRELAGIERRFLACLVDAWVLVFLDTLIGWISLKILVGPDFSWGEPEQIHVLMTKLRLFMWPFIFFLLTVHVSYHTYLIGAQGQTPGKRLWGIRVIGVESDRIGYGRALIRGCAGFFSALPLGLGFFWALLDPHKQTWHDKVAGTLVVRYRIDRARCA